MNKPLLSITERIERIKKKLVDIKKLVTKAEQKKANREEKLELTI